MNTPIFRILCAASYMSLFEAAEYLNIRVDTAKEMWIGQRQPADGILIEMKKLIDSNIVRAMRQDCELVSDMTPEQLLEKYKRTDRSKVKSDTLTV